MAAAVVKGGETAPTVRFSTLFHSATPQRTVCKPVLRKVFSTVPVPPGEAG
jgi:hypothetical protein